MIPRVDHDVEGSEAFVETAAVSHTEIHVDTEDLAEQAGLLDVVRLVIQPEDGLCAPELGGEGKKAGIAADVEHGFAAKIPGKAKAVQDHQKLVAEQRPRGLEATPTGVLNDHALVVSPRSPLFDQPLVSAEFSVGKPTVEQKAVASERHWHGGAPPWCDRRGSSAERQSRRRSSRRQPTLASKAACRALSAADSSSSNRT